MLITANSSIVICTEPSLVVAKIISSGLANDAPILAGREYPIGPRPPGNSICECLLSFESIVKYVGVVPASRVIVTFSFNCFSIVCIAFSGCSFSVCAYFFGVVSFCDNISSIQFLLVFGNLFLFNSSKNSFI